MKVSGDGSAQLRLEEAFAFKTQLLQPGDVLLSTNSLDKLSGMIRWGTGGSFSHAAICTLPPLFIEADFPGVAEVSLERKHLATLSNARILRLDPSFPDAKKIAETAAKAALEYQTGSYDKIAAVASVFKGAKTNSGLFCSYLVSAAYLKAGLNITSEGKLPKTTTPADIEHFAGFVDITPSLLIRINLFPEALYFFLDRSPQYPIGTEDEGELPSPAQLYNIALRKVGEAVSRFLESKGKPAVDRYTDAQKALALYRDETWFLQLDALFASSLR